ncbi:MAG: efflux RND transporter periplasmic adaptor subunit [Woeseiaceae bacterium]|nr:efflux RND transporter periplasmic adaptor subunit [Woeseiaceae bacterium]MDX2609114.1 efflux RND transporter periplasmic adaptor subunit [Woeseiaceae bacterium]
MTKLRLLLPAIFLFACAEEQSSAPIYDKAAVERHSISVSVGSSGAVEPLAKIEVKSKASGEVLELLVATGDYVEQGALMVNIDPRTVTNRLAQAEAELKAALSRRQISISQMTRAERLVKQGTFTEADYEQAALELANAEAQVVTAEVTVENARIAVDDTDIRAPVSGTVIAKPVEKGQVISSPTQDVGGGTLLLTMADLSAVQIRALVDETDIGKIRAGMQAEVTVAAYPNQPFPGEVIKIEPQAVLEQNVTMFAVLISISNPEGLLMPGMNAEVEISVARRNDVLAIPVMALRTERDVATTAGILGITETELRGELAEGGDKAAAAPGSGRKRGGDKDTDYRFGGDFWVVIEEQDGGTRIANVKAGLTDLDRVEIISGLEENDRVFILPSAHLVETQEQLQRWINRRVGSVPGIGSN